MPQPTAPILRQWRAISRLPIGPWLFSRLAGWTVPYAATIRARVVELEPGKARAQMRDRRRVRNHLKSIHAVALVNLAEMTANLALMALQPKDGRWIITGIEADYVKKARGRVEASCEIDGDVDWSTDQEIVGRCVVRDETGDVVVEFRPKWKIGPKRRK